MVIATDGEIGEQGIAPCRTMADVTNPSVDSMLSVDVLTPEHRILKMQTRNAK